VILLEMLLDFYRSNVSAIHSELVEARATYEDMNDKSTITHNGIAVSPHVLVSSYSQITCVLLGRTCDGGYRFLAIKFLDGHVWDEFPSECAVQHPRSKRSVRAHLLHVIMYP
jgi:hypothetical protein